MLNLNGAYVIMGGSNAPFLTVLSQSANDLYKSRYSVVGYVKAVTATFGYDATQALPTTTACLDSIINDYAGPWSRELKILCARIVLGKWDDADVNPNGGDKVTQGKPKPRKPSPSNSINPAVGLTTQHVMVQ